MSTTLYNTLLYGGIGLGILALIAVTIVVIKKLKIKKQIEQDGQYWIYQNAWLKNTFSNNDVAVYGFKGNGKDVTFAHVINLIGGRHYSNIFYNHFTELKNIDDLNVGGNTFYDLHGNTLKEFEPNFEDGYHMYISDAGVYLGCQYNQELNKNCAEIPIHLALRRHLYDSHIHTNSQALTRVWDKFREQQSAFIRCLECKRVGEYFYVTAITYTEYESALAKKSPPGRKKEQTEEDILRDGEIVKRRFRVPVKSLTYDTREFRKKFFKGYYQQEIKPLKHKGVKTKYGYARHSNASRRQSNTKV